MALICGVEISTDNLKYVVVSKTRHGLHPRAYGRHELAEDVSPGRLLSQVLAEKKLNVRTIRVAAGTQASQLRNLTLPNMPRNELRSVIQEEISRELEILDQDMASGYQVLKDREHKNQRVLLALTPRRGMLDLYEDLTQTGLEVELMTTSSAALLGHALSHKGLANRRECLGVLHLGVDRMVLTIIERGQIRLLRDLGLGLDTALLAGQDEEVATGTDGPVRDLEMIDMLSQGLHEMTQVSGQVRRTLGYYANQSPESPVTGLLLAGDVARAEAMVPLLENELSLPVDLLNPLNSTQVDSGSYEFRQEGASYAIPIALVDLDRPKDAIHLGPRQTPERPSAFALAGVSAAVLSSLLFAMTPSLNGRVARSEDQLRKIDDQKRLQQMALAPSLAAGDGSALTSEETLALLEGPIPLEPLVWLAGRFPRDGRLETLRFSRTAEGWSVSLSGSFDQESLRRRVSTWREFLQVLELDPQVRGLHIDEVVGGSGFADDMIPLGVQFTRENRPPAQESGSTNPQPETH